MSDEEIAKVVNTLVGGITPIADSHYDRKTLENICLLGNVIDYNEKFAKAEQNLKAKYPDAEIINTTVLDKLPLTYDEYMELDLRLIDMCGAIYMLNGWEMSKGACIEYGYALAKDLIVLKESVK